MEHSLIITQFYKPFGVFWQFCCRLVFVCAISVCVCAVAVYKNCIFVFAPP